jgi:hypothetical protein
MVRKNSTKDKAVSEKATAKRDDPEQSNRFIEAARKAGADETEEGANRAFKKIARTPRRKDR